MQVLAQQQEQNVSVGEHRWEENKALLYFHFYPSSGLGIAFGSFWNFFSEFAGEFVRSNELQEGDFIVIYSDVKSGKYVMVTLIILFPGNDYFS
jgi:hypothetical protein